MINTFSFDESKKKAMRVYRDKMTKNNGQGLGRIGRIMETEGILSATQRLGNTRSSVNTNRKGYDNQTQGQFMGNRGSVSPEKNLFKKPIQVNLENPRPMTSGNEFQKKKRNFIDGALTKD